MGRERDERLSSRLATRRQVWSRAGAKMGGGLKRNGSATSVMCPEDINVAFLGARASGSDVARFGEDSLQVGVDDARAGRMTGSAKGFSF